MVFSGPHDSNINSLSSGGATLFFFFQKVGSWRMLVEANEELFFSFC